MYCTATDVVNNIVSIVICHWSYFTIVYKVFIAKLATAAQQLFRVGRKNLTHFGPFVLLLPKTLVVTYVSFCVAVLCRILLTISYFANISTNYMQAWIYNDFCN